MSMHPLRSGRPQLPRNRLRFGIGVFVASAALLLVPTPVAAHEPRVPKLPSNTGCQEFAVLVKASVTEDRAAANMLAEALRLRSGDRCLVDVADGVAVGKQIDSGAVKAGRQVVFVVGGPAAISDELLVLLDIDRVARVSGADRWATQRAVVQIIWNLRGDDEYLPEVTLIQRGASLSPRTEDADEAELWEWTGWGNELDGFAGSARQKRSASGNSGLVIACDAGDALRVAIVAESGIFEYFRGIAGIFYVTVSYRVGPVGTTVSDGANWSVRTEGASDYLFMPTTEQAAFIAAVRAGLFQGHTDLHGLFLLANGRTTGEWDLAGWEREVEQVLRTCGY